MICSAGIFLISLSISNHDSSIARFKISSTLDPKKEMLGKPKKKKKILAHITAPKMKFPDKTFSSKCKQICRNPKTVFDV